MRQLVFAALAVALFTLPGCDLLESSASATVSVRQADGAAPACCPMEAGSGAAADVAAEAIGDCSESVASECSEAQCDIVEDCEIAEDCEIQCDEGPCEIEEAPCDKDGGSQQ